MDVERWWKHAVIFDVSANGEMEKAGAAAEDLRSVTAHMDDLQTLGVDAILIRNPPPVQPVSGAHEEGAGDWTSRLEAFDDLIQQASRRRLRVLVELRPSMQADLTARARFWLNRGIAGFYLPNVLVSAKTAGANEQPASALQDEVLALRDMLKRFAGERIVISEMPATISAASADEDTSFVTQAHGGRRPSSTVAAANATRGGAGDPEMTLVRVIDPSAGTGATTMRISLERAIQRINTIRSTPLLALAENAGQHPLALTPTGDAVLGKVEAAILLGIGAPAMIEARGLALPEAASEPAGGVGGAPQSQNRYAVAARAAKAAAAREAAAVLARRSLYEWYRQLNALAHGNPTLRSGGNVVLDRDSENALVWVRTPKGAGPNVVLACNLSAKPITISLVDDFHRLHLRGSFLRTMLRSDDRIGPMSLNAVVLPPFAVYIGELGR